MLTSNILHASTEPTLLARLKEMLRSSARADIAVGYFFISGFETVAEDLSRLDKARILVGRTDRSVMEEVAASLQQSQPLKDQLYADSLVQKSRRSEVAQQAVEHIAEGVSVLPQERGTESAVTMLRDLVASAKVEVRAYLKSPLHAKAYLCWYDNHAEPGAAVVGSSNLTLAGFEGNTELNVRSPATPRWARCAIGSMPCGRTRTISARRWSRSWTGLGCWPILRHIMCT